MRARIDHVNVVGRSSALSGFADAVGLWRIAEPNAALELVDAATDLLVAGWDSPALRILAGTSPRESRFAIEPLLQEVLEQLDLLHLMEGAPERAALAATVRRFLAGSIGLRELSSWAHSAIGHDGDHDCQPFVLLDDIYDDWEYAGRDLGHLEHIARREAEAFIAGKPSTALSELWPP